MPFISSIGILGYFAGRNAANNPVQPTASPAAALAASATPATSPQVSSPSPIATSVQQVSFKPAAPAAPATPVVTWTQQENDYLYDLSQALQHSEVRRTTAADKLSIGHTIAGWLDAGADYWGMREKFDAQYGGTPADDSFNREVYIKYATMRFSPGHADTLNQPPPPPVVITQTVVETQPAPAQEVPAAPSEQPSVESPAAPEPEPAPSIETVPVHLSNCNGVPEPGEIPNPNCRHDWEEIHNDEGNSHHGDSGRCLHPDDLDSAGHRCGGRSADSRPGGGGKQ